MSFERSDDLSLFDSLWEPVFLRLLLGNSLQRQQKILWWNFLVLHPTSTVAGTTLKQSIVSKFGSDQHPIALTQPHSILIEYLIPVDKKKNVVSALFYYFDVL